MRRFKSAETYRRWLEGAETLRDPLTALEIQEAEALVEAGFRQLSRKYRTIGKVQLNPELKFTERRELSLREFKAFRKVGGGPWSYVDLKSVEKT